MIKNSLRKGKTRGENGEIGEIEGVEELPVFW